MLTAEFFGGPIDGKEWAIEPDRDGNPPDHYTVMIQPGILIVDEFGIQTFQPKPDDSVKVPPIKEFHYKKRGIIRDGIVAYDFIGE